MASAAIAPIVIPYKPRPLQKLIHQGMASRRWGVVVCHRRFGKTVCALNHLIRSTLQATKMRPRFAYIGPTYTQAKSTAWDYLKYYTEPILDRQANESELRVDLPGNGSQIRIFGADRPDSLRGHYFDGVVLDEYGLMDDDVFSAVVRPMLADRQGWALFMGTPNGTNQFYRIVQDARHNSEWFFAEYPASQTGVLSEDELASARASMTEDEYLREFECSFEASVKGAVYARELLAARHDGRITRVPHDPALPVDTDWDLGVGGSCAIWFSQSCYSGEVRLIRYLEGNGAGFDHYKRQLDDCSARFGYTYGTHWAPHDIEVREISSAHTRLALAWQIGLQFVVSPKVQAVDDGIHAARMMFGRCWFDGEQCADGITALSNYRWNTNTKFKSFTELPVKDGSAHGADAFRGLAYRQYAPRKASERAQLLEAQREPPDRRRWDNRPDAGRGGY